MAILLTIFGALSPYHHKYIKEEEKNFIFGKVRSGVEKVDIIIIKLFIHLHAVFGLPTLVFEKISKFLPTLKHKIFS